MSDSVFNDSTGQVLQDLLLWIEQNQGIAQGLYYDQGAPQPFEVSGVPVEAASVLSVEPPVSESNAEPIAEPIAEAPANSIPQLTLPPKTILPPLPNLIAPGDAFQAECDQFVQRSLSMIKEQESAGQNKLAIDSLVHQYGGQAEAMADLTGTVKGCQACALHKSRTTTVFGAGNPNAAVVFIGEAPGRDEDLQGEPFVGQSGQLLTKILGAIGLSREEIFICNILKCRPPENRDPDPQEVIACEDHLKRQLAILQPRLICCLGRIAAQTLLGTSATLGALRRTVHFYAGIPVMATYHPAALLRNPSWKKDVWNDVRKLRNLHDALDQGSV